jgi:hypothetical protein
MLQLCHGVIPASRATGPLGLLDRELTERMGLSSTRAAMIYQHATRDREKAIAKPLGGVTSKARNEFWSAHCSIGHTAGTVRTLTHADPLMVCPDYHGDHSGVDVLLGGVLR